MVPIGGTRKGAVSAVSGLVLLVLLAGAGIAVGYGFGTSLSSAASANTVTITSTTTASSTGNQPKYADVTVVAVADLRLGSDNDTHDTFAPSNFTVYVGQTVNLTLVNYDDMSHSFTSTSLGVDFNIPPATSDGVPSVSHYQFTVTKAGSYRFWCVTPCDDWAMQVDPKDGQPGMLGFMGGYVNVQGA